MKWLFVVSILMAGRGPDTDEAHIGYRTGCRNSVLSQRPDSERDGAGTRDSGPCQRNRIGKRKKRGLEQLLFFLLPYSSKTSPSERTALRTHSGQGHRTLPVPMPFKSLQMVAPHLRSKFCTSSLEIRGVPLPSVKMPATMTAPIRAPQVLSIKFVRRVHRL